MPVRRALLVGCNYPGTNAALNGCVNDVWGTKDMLMRYYGFQEADITVMIDTDRNYTQPTGANIKRKLAEMVAQSQDGDCLVFHFSGHGTQVPSDDAAEVDGKDEAICPTDMNLLTDDDLRAIFSPLGSKPGVRFTFIADCCHSGTILDHNEVIITGPKPGGPPPPPIDTQAIQNMLAALGGRDVREFKNRALPFNDLTSILSEMLGQPVGQGNLRSSMGSLFGADASLKVQQYMKYAQYAKQAIDMLQGKAADGTGGNKDGGGFLGILSACLGMCVGAAGPAAGGSGGMNGHQGYAGGAPVPPNGLPAAVVPGAKPPPGQQLPEDVGVLITGCQDKETSADACPSGDKAKAHGALSNALQTVVRQHHAAYPGQPLTYRNLILAVREALAKSGFAQNPCLECAHKYADVPFVVGE